MTTTLKSLSLDQIETRFGTDESAREYLEAVRWPDGPVCPHCGNGDAARIYDIKPNPEKKIRAGLRECKECGDQFTVTVGTVFEKSKIPLRKWLVAWYMLWTSKKGISALQIQSMLGLGSYRSACFMIRRIRYALRDPVFSDKLGGNSGTVEVDETYIGGKIKGKSRREYTKDLFARFESVIAASFVPYEENGDALEDERDAEIARKRLSEIRTTPKLLVEGEKLRERLAEIES